MTFHSNQLNLFERISKILNSVSKTHLFAPLFIKIYSQHLLCFQYQVDSKIINCSICHFIPSLSSLSFPVLDVEMVSNTLLRD